MKTNKLLRLLLAAILLGIVLEANSCGQSDYSGNRLTGREGIWTEYEFNDQGQIVAQTDYSGRKTIWSYDDAGQLAKVEYPDSNVKYSYDELGNCVSMSDANGRTEYSYDAFNRPVCTSYYRNQVVQTDNTKSPVKQVQYTYDAWDRVAKISILDSNQVEEYSIRYAYDIQDRLILAREETRSLAGAQGVPVFSDTSYEYFTLQNKVVRTLPNNIQSTFRFDMQGRLSGIEHLKPDGSQIADFSLSYKNGNLISDVTTTTPTGTDMTHYSYDSLGRLTSLIDNEATRLWKYDSGGRLGEVQINSDVYPISHDPLGRITRIGSIDVEFSPGTNEISLLELDDVTRLKFNSRGMLSSIWNNGINSSFGFDGNGSLAKSSIDSQELHIIPNMPNSLSPVLASFDNSGKLQEINPPLGTLHALTNPIDRSSMYALENLNIGPNLLADNFGNLSQVPYGSPFSMELPDPVMMAIPDYAMPRLEANLMPTPPLRSMPIEVRPQSLMEPLGYMEMSMAKLPDLLAPRSQSFDPISLIKPMDDIAWLPRMPDIQFKGVNALDPYPLHQPLGYVGTRTYGWRDMQAGGADVSHDFNSGLGTEELRAREPEYYAYIDSLDQTMEFTIEGYTKVAGPVLKTTAISFAQGFLALLSSKVPKIIGPLIRPLNKVLDDQADRSIGELRKIDPYATGQFKRGRQGYKDMLDVVNNTLGVVDTLKGWGHDADQIGKALYLYATSGSLLDLKRQMPSIEQIEERLGGIKLAQEASFLADLGRIEYAVIDPETGRMVLVGDGDTALPSLRPEDLAVALYCVYGPIACDPKFTLDPADPTNPEGPWIEPKWMPEELLKGTTFGNIMFEADWLLKLYGVGVEEDSLGRFKQRVSTVPGFKSEPDLIFADESQSTSKPLWSRQWIVSRNMVVNEDQDGLYFEVAEMGVNSMRMEQDASGRLTDVATQDPISAAFARNFSDLYDEIAVESPVFEELRQLAKAVAIAKWMKKEGIEVDMEWVYTNANHRVPYTSKVRANTFEDTRPISGGTSTVRIFGGINLTVKPQFVEKPGITAGITDAVHEAMQSNPFGAAFEIEADGMPYSCVVMPMIADGGELWSDEQSDRQEDLITYDSESGNVTEIAKLDGSTAKFQYNELDHLVGANWQIPGGWQLAATRDEDSSTTVLRTPTDHEIAYMYNQDGLPTEIVVDGNQYARFAFDESRNAIEVYYQDGSKATTRFDPAGQMLESTATYAVPGRGMKTESIALFSEDDGRTVTVASNGQAILQITNPGDSVTSAITPAGEFSYTYDSEDRLVELAHGSESTIKWSYGDSGVMRLILTSGEALAEFFFTDEQITSLTSFNGDVTFFNYDNSGRLTAIDFPDMTCSYSYSEAGQLDRIELPDQRKIEFERGIRSGDTVGSNEGGTWLIVSVFAADS